MANLLENFGGHCGLISPLLFMLSAVLAIASYPGYNPAVDYLSHLGIDPHSYLFFNIGVAVSGILGILFSMFLWKRFPAGLARSGAFLIGAGLMSFTMISVFTEESFMLHLFFAGLFFALAFLSFVLVGIGLLRDDRKLSALSFLMAALILPLPLSGFSALAEHIAVAAIIVWSFAMWMNFKSRKDEEYEWLWAYEY